MRPGGIRVDGAAAPDVDGLLRSNALTMAPGSTYVYDLAIEQVAPEAGATGPTTIVPGTYTLSCLVSLIALTPSDPPGATLTSGDVQVVVQ